MAEPAAPSHEKENFRFFYPFFSEEFFLSFIFQHHGTLLASFDVASNGMI